MAEPIYVWTDRTDGPHWGYWDGWNCHSKTIRAAAEYALRGAPEGKQAHATRRMGVRTLTLTSDGKGGFR